MSSFIVYNPTGGPTPQITRQAARAQTLDGAVLGVIDNGKHNSDKVLGRLVDLLQQRFSLQRVVRVTKRSFSHAISEDDANRLAAECQFVIAGVGD